MKNCLVILLFLFSLTSLFSQKSPFSISDLYDIDGVSDPGISPDGKRVAFVVTEYNLKEGSSNSDLYIMNIDGSDMKRMTREESTDNHPRWAPDGKTLLFSSDRSGEMQLWEIPVDGGEARQLTSFPGGVSNPVWSPDGRKIAFAANVFPECGASAECNKKIRESMEKGPLKAHMADHLLYRHWNFWKDGKRSHILLLDTDTDSLLDLTPGDYDSPSFSLGGGPGFDFSPDGSELCYVSNHDLREAETTNKDLWLVSTAGGDAQNITDDNEAFDGDPVYSPDGRYIAYITQLIPGYESDLFRLAIYDRSTGKKEILTADFDYWVQDIRWAPDSRSIYFAAQVKGHVPLYRITVKNEKIESVIHAKTIDYYDVTPDNQWAVLARRSVGEPREIWRVRTSGKNLQRLTFFTREVQERVDIRPAEEMWIPSPTGRDIHTFIVKPHNFDENQKYPLILNVHGGPQQQWTDGFRGDWQVYPGSGYVVAFPNPHGSAGYGQEFTAAISEDWGGKVYEDIMAVTDSLSRISWIDENRMGAMGWSYGGYMMMWLEGHTDRFKALAAMMGVYNLVSKYGATEELWFPEWDLGGTPWEVPELYAKWSPSSYVKNFKTPCLIITGEKDFRVSYTQSLEFFTALQKMKVPSRLIVF
ncbi:MAG: S9 family peptidase, partial [Calditrichaeota bacterium]